jgi:hypothetical protein
MLKLSKLNIQTRSDKSTVLAVAIKIEDPDVEVIVVLVHSATRTSTVSRFIAVPAGSINVARYAIYRATVDIQSYERSLPS